MNQVHTDGETRLSRATAQHTQPRIIAVTAGTVRAPRAGMTLEKWIICLCWWMLATGCGGSHDETTEHQDLAIAPYVDALVIPGTILTLSISHYLAQTTCTYEDHIHPDPPSCSTVTTHEPISLETIECKGAGCSAARLTNEQLTLTSDRPGRITLTVTARLLQSQQLLTRSWEFTFSEVQRVAIEFKLGAHGAAAPVMIGTSFFWCASAKGAFGGAESGIYLASLERQLLVDGTVLAKPQWETNEWRLPRIPGLVGCLSFKAVSAGRGSFAVQLGHATWTVGVDVVAPTDVVALRALEPLDEPSDPYATPKPVMKAVGDASTKPGAFAAARLGCDASHPLALRQFFLGYQLRDGRIAVGAHEGTRSAVPETFCVERNSAPDPGSPIGAVALQPLQPGSGNLRIWLASVEYALPVVVYASADACAAAS